MPINALSLLHFIKIVRRQHAVTHPSPLLVHCSAGVGRTGSFVVLDVMLQRMKERKNLTIHDFITQLRTQRVFMVQSLVSSAYDYQTCMWHEFSPIYRQYALKFSTLICQTVLQFCKPPTYQTLLECSLNFVSVH